MVVLYVMILLFVIWVAMILLLRSGCDEHIFVCVFEFSSEMDFRGEASAKGSSEVVMSLCVLTHGK